MALPQKVVAALFPLPDAPPYGFPLGTPAGEVRKALPDWFEKPVPDLTGETWGSVGEEDQPRLSAYLTFSVGRLSRSTASMDLESEEDLESAFRELADHFDEMFGVGKLATKKKKRVGEWEIKGDVPGTLRLEAGPYSMRDMGDDLWRMELCYQPADGVKIKPLTDSPAWIDVEKLGAQVATKKWPAGKCAEIFRRFFSFDDEWSAASSDESLTKTLGEIYQALKEDRPDLKDTLRGFLALCDWSKLPLDGDYDANRLRYCMSQIGHYSMNLSVAPGRNQGICFHTNVRVLGELVSALTSKPSDRAGWGWKVLAALEFGDEQARAEVVAALGAFNNAGKHQRLTFDSTPEIDRDCFALITSGLGDDDRIRWAWKADYRDSSVRAATSWLVSAKKLSPPAVKPAGLKWDEEKKYAQTWAEHLAAVRALSPALFLEAVGACLDSLDYNQRSAGAVMAVFSDEKKQTVDGESYWNAYRVGSWVVTHSGKGDKGGRLTSKRFDDEKKAARDFAKKIAAH